jgi:D-3-phosphoglycerate dehydrogenase
VNDPLDPLVLDLLEWIGPRSRPYADVMDAWRTSCPRLPVWEEANARGYLAMIRSPDGTPSVALTALGRTELRMRRRLDFPDAAVPGADDGEGAPPPRDGFGTSKRISGTG